jgi:tripartite-type tricarboxylate transporter receptor subunit TctC
LVSKPAGACDAHHRDQATNTTGPILSKQVKAYAITTKSRLPSLPDLPTADEAGLKGFELAVWHGVFAPRGTPPRSCKGFPRRSSAR